MGSPHKPSRGKSGRRIKTDPETFERLARAGSTYQDVADHYGCALSTIEKRMKQPEYREAWERGAAVPKRSLRLAMYRFVGINEDGQLVDIEHKHNPTAMMIFLAKNVLGMTDRVVTETVENQRSYMVVPPDKSTEDWIKEHGEVVVDQRDTAKPN